ncbi:hypothetical protein [Rhodococcus sp. ARC_M6]|uniref:hypothetical protein n=1 Tax=Rhodococcus sp. ARC_M6 TaxID=2928852 RepID=UPI001FB2FA9C|nr:hypothetical protein [Rhodococcus sp. ARC_M6]MCJ0906176.1 hypothetical protein [Rhodococcus sp. ARC_M6]
MTEQKSLRHFIGCTRFSAPHLVRRGLTSPAPAGQGKAARSDGAAAGSGFTAVAGTALTHTFTVTGSLGSLNSIFGG